MRNLDFTNWHALLLSLFGLALVTLIGVGLRLVAMQAIQQRRERENRQINERLRTLIAAYKTLGGSFTGNLAVDPTHLRDLRRRGESTIEATTEISADAVESTISEADDESSGSDRARRVRDAVEAALSDIILLGTEDQVRLAANAAADLVAGRHVHTHELVVALRDFIRGVLDLDSVPSDLPIPKQGPTRPSSSSSSRGGKGGGEGAGREGGGRSGGRGGGGGMGMGAGMGLGIGGGLAIGEDDSHHH
ncbi:MAG TPA: hypothetical protein VHC92_12190 [Rhodanobacteraceae bacterium]|nr:hypothetical protein [Rhodanobacteraceae bacterium]